MPFDRLVRAVDAWAGRAGRTDVFAQVGDSSYRPTHVRWVKFLGPDDFVRAVREADVVVGHAGTGTILCALENRRPVLVMPRRASLRETRNDHQLATVRRLEALDGVAVALAEEDLEAQLDRLSDLKAGTSIRRDASPELIRALREFLGNRCASRH